MRPADPESVLPVFVRPGERLPKGVRSVELESGGELQGGALLDRDAPYGYHQLLLSDGRRMPMVTSPGR